MSTKLLGNGLENMSILLALVILPRALAEVC